MTTDEKIKSLLFEIKQTLVSAADLPIQSLDDGLTSNADDRIPLARFVDGVWVNYYTKPSYLAVNPLSIYFQQELPNADAAMSIGGLFMNRTVISPANPTYSLPQGGSSVIPTGSIISFINVGSNLPTIMTSGSDRIVIDGTSYVQIRPQLVPAGNQYYNVSFIRISSGAWMLILNGPFTGALNAS